jgi:hypothetical protein
MRRHALLTALAVLVLAAPASAAISLKAYAKRANAACATANRQLDAVANPTSAKQFPRFFRDVVGILKPLNKTIEAIPLPSTKAGTAKRALQLQLQLTAITENTLRRLESGVDPAAEYKRWDKATEAGNNRLNTAWRALGARTCSD